MSNILTFVLICTYNGDLFLKDQIISILNQSTPIFKIYIYDFGSTDNTIELILKLKNKFNDRIILNQFKKKDNVAHSFITALSDISVKIPINSLLYICDQDDYWLIDKNEYVLSNFYESDLPLIFHHDVLLVNKNLENLNLDFYSNNIKRLFLKSISHRTYFSTIIGHTICMNFNSIKYLTSFHYNERIIMHDWFWGALVEYNGVVIFLNKKLSLYRQHDSNIIGANLKNNRNLIRIKNIFNMCYLVSKQLNYINSIGFNFTKKYFLFISLCLTRNFKEAITFTLILILFYFLKFIDFLNKIYLKFKLYIF
jgi:rhamnosyltransferase